MNVYTYGDFYAGLNQCGKEVLHEIHGHITTNYPDYQPVDIKPKNNQNREWSLTYRKKPKCGKGLCSLQSTDGEVSLRFPCLTSLVSDFLQGNHNLSKKTAVEVRKQMVCSVALSCRSYGGNTVCPYRQYFWVDRHLIRVCPYPWIQFDHPAVEQLSDIKAFIDLQIKHMAQDKKEIKGGTYEAENIERCGEVKIIAMEGNSLTAEQPSAFHSRKLSQYIKLYHLVPIGENNGLWFYRSSVNYSNQAQGLQKIPQGRYASITIADSLSFSLNRSWNYICKWLDDHGEKVAGVDLDSENAACLVHLYNLEQQPCMALYVPIL